MDGRQGGIYYAVIFTWHGMIWLETGSHDQEVLLRHAHANYSNCMEDGTSSLDEANVLL